MKHWIVLCLFVLPMAGAASDLQVLTVDEHHIQIGHAEGEQGNFYAIDSAAEIEIDERQYFIRWEPGTTRYRLSQGTMVPRDREFGGFLPGDRFIIAIGQLGLDHTNEQVFMVQWAGIGRVRH